MPVRCARLALLGGDRLAGIAAVLPRQPALLHLLAAPAWETGMEPGALADCAGDGEAQVPDPAALQAPRAEGNRNETADARR